MFGRHSSSSGKFVHTASDKKTNPACMLLTAIFQLQLSTFSIHSNHSLVIEYSHKPLKIPTRSGRKCNRFLLQWEDFILRVSDVEGNSNQQCFKREIGVQITASSRPRHQRVIWLPVSSTSFCKASEALLQIVRQIGNLFSVGQWISLWHCLCGLFWSIGCGLCSSRCPSTYVCTVHWWTSAAA